MPSKSMKTISSRLQDTRRRAGLTQKELASKCNLSTNYISRIERGAVSPTVDTLEKLVKALRVKSSDILPF